MWLLWVAVILAGLLLAAILVLSVPVDLELRLEACGQSQFKMKVVWLFGLLGWEIGGRKRKVAGKKAVKQREKNRKKEPGKG